MHLFLPHFPHLPHLQKCFMCLIEIQKTNHPQNKPITNNNQQSQNKHTNISYLLHFCRYRCDTCVSYLYFKPFLGIWASARPLSPFWSSDATLSFLKFYIIFFLIFFIFIFFLSCLFHCVLILHSICTLFCPTIA